MTEDEAKTRWCPFARYYGAGNRFEGDSEAARDARADCLCIASACMAWRCEPSPDLSLAKAERNAGSTLNAIKELRAVYPKMGLLEAKNRVEAQDWPETGHGFCGLAGQP